MKLLLYFFILFLPGIHQLPASEDHKIMIVIIDGARYSETFGDSTHQYTPRMWGLAAEGTIINRFYNNGVTKTNRAVPALWCGAWTAMNDTVYNGGQTIYSEKPSIFEYYRKDKSASESDCYYILPYLPDLWLPSFDVDYGPDYWPTFHSLGENDNDVAENTKDIIDNYHPKFLWVYLADVDHAGHSGDWEYYTSTISNADEIVADLWGYLQNDPFYAGTTTMIVTNDHGRHSDNFGGFQGHGCGCEGCRHIQFLALGPRISKNQISNTYRTIPDMAVTAAYIMGVEPTKASGTIMQEIFEPNSVNSFKIPGKENVSVIPNPVSSATKITFITKNVSDVIIKVTDIFGRCIEIKKLGTFNEGKHIIYWNDMGFSLNTIPGVYSLSIETQSGSSSEIIIVPG